MARVRSRTGQSTASIDGLPLDVALRIHRRSRVSHLSRSLLSDLWELFPSERGSGETRHIEKCGEMWNNRSAISLLVVLCMSIMPAAAYACHGPSSHQPHPPTVAAGDMVDCPFATKKSAKPTKHSGDLEDRGSNCEPAACFLKCFHSAAIILPIAEPGELPLCFDVADFLPPPSPPHEPPTPPPQI